MARKQKALELTLRDVGIKDEADVEKAKAIVARGVKIDQLVIWVKAHGKGILGVLTTVAGLFVAADPPQAEPAVCHDQADEK